MEKRKWLWKRKSAEKSPGETESSGSISSHSERYSDEQEALKASPNHNSQSPEVTSKAVVTGEEVNNTIRSLTEKLSAALVNVSAKDDLVKQHSKVAEEAVAGWEKAEIEMVILKQQLEAAVQKNLALEDRVAHLDGALKECVRQLRQARDEQEQRIHEAVVEKTRDWEATKLELENRLLELQIQAESTISNSVVSIDPNLHNKLESFEKENSVLKLELLSRSEELEIRNMEMELSTKAAETASKQNLESIKKVARLEAECQRLQAMVRKSSTLNHHKSITSSSICVESLTDSQSDSGERLNSVELDTQKINRLETSECDPNCSDSWASALIAELDQFKNEKAINRSLTACSVEIGMMDDFLEMERLAALPETKSKGHLLEPDAVSNHSANCENPLRAELEAMIHRMADLEEKLKKIEAERAELENALTVSQNSLEASQFQLTEAEMRLEELQRELTLVNESKELLESQLICTEMEARTMSANVDLLKAEVEREQSLSAEMAVKCQDLEDKLARRTHDVELQQTASSNSNLKIKQEDFAVAAGKLAECQKTIVSLGRQLQSLATLEDFLIDTESLPVVSDGGSQIPKASGEPWNLHSKDSLLPKSDLDGETTHPLLNDNNVEPASSLSTSSAVPINLVSSVKIRNGFGKFFSRSRSGVQLESQQR